MATRRLRGAKHPDHDVVGEGPLWGAFATLRAEVDVDPYLSDWANLLLRWFHLVAGAAWIGASFYFNWLNNHVREEEHLPEGRKELWAVHGGAFYRVLKYAGAPEKLPKTLHWFKYEAYFTWLSGIGLLAVVYYLNAKSYLIDPAVADLTESTAVIIGVSSLVSGWLVYDLMCRSPLVKKPVAFTTLGLLIGVLAAWALSQVFSGRGAYIHVGAIIGTCMAANVFFVIIPGQKAMVAAMVAGKEPPVEQGQAGSLRSLHNNYFTLPVLFIMVSNHFPMTYGHGANWAILAALAVISAGVRHWFNLRGRGELNVWILPTATVLMVSLAFVMRPDRAPVAQVEGGVSYDEIAQIMEARCTTCHAEAPTHASFASPPLGVMLDTPQRVADQVLKINTVVVITKTMPLGNLTGMTDAERGKVAAWIDAGAPQ